MKNLKTTYNILICGVGGQGIILASKLLAESALSAGFDIKQSEVHGMSQRGGSVVSFIRFGKKIFSPIISKQSADFILSFEKMETLRYLDYANKDTKFLIADTELRPNSVNTGKYHYPENITEILDKYEFKNYVINAAEIALKLGDIRAVNTVMFGVLSNFLPISENIITDTLKNILPTKILELNLSAFAKGKNCLVA
ncbi:MAG TPA: indolepyruvate oxidoreductase subunit beta [bacterium]|nr:indolepyruvate oxidoreductase subunit beta [bacterium]